MLGIERMRASGVPGFIARNLVIALTVTAAGCSAEVTRFDFIGNKQTTTNSIPIPEQSVGNNYSGPPRGLGLTEAPLPPANDPPPTQGLAGNNYNNTATPPPSGPQGDPTYRVVGRQYKTPPANQNAAQPAPQFAALPKQQPPYQPAYQPQQQPAPNAGTVEVQPGETLYGVSRRTGTSVTALKDANGLTGDSVRPGQRLVLPADAQDPASIAPPSAKAPAAPDRTALAKYTPPPAPERAPLSKQAPPVQAAQPAVEAPPGWEGRYTMKNGDSLYGIALQHRVTLDELKRANGITDPTKVWTGTVLNVPARAEQAQPPPAQNTPPRIIQVAPRVINSAPDVSPKALQKPSNDGPADVAPPAAANGKFNWPVRGKVIAGFGKRPDGTHNDGVNVAVPMGTAVHAVEGGKVAYAGSELKGYGNLVLIRHPNGWVSAYAHADQILVKANDEVRRGQIIARSGNTGSVDQPQLHFELRQGSRPVDPVPHLAAN
jgi:murein DD-endopeptidase MepM/ murein hydrolase activator NlpD